MTYLRRTIGVVLIAALAVATPSIAEAAPPPTAPPLSVPPLDPARLAAAIAGLPDAEASAALVQLRGSAGHWDGSAGIASIRDRRPPRADSRFRIGSMTKTFTAVVVLQLAAEGRVDLDAPVQRYLPRVFPHTADYRAPIPVRSLLNWTSGLRGVGVDSKDWTWFREHRFDHWPRGSQLDVSQPPLFGAGKFQNYANVDYIVAGLLVEKVTGRTWESEVRRRIITPLGLSGTSVPVDDPRIPGPHVHGYEATPDGWADVTRTNPSLQWSAAAMISTAPDLDRFLVALFSGRLLPPAQLAEMFTVPDVPQWGSATGRATYSAGLTRSVVNGIEVWVKSGDRPGYNNAMAATRDLSRRLVYSVNPLHMGQNEPTGVAQRIIMASVS